MLVCAPVARLAISAFLCACSVLGVRLQGVLRFNCGQLGEFEGLLDALSLTWNISRSNTVLTGQLLAIHLTLLLVGHQVFYVSICGPAAETSHAYLGVFYVNLQKPHSSNHIVPTFAFLFPQEVTVAGVPC